MIVHQLPPDTEDPGCLPILMTLEYVLLAIACTACSWAATIKASSTLEAETFLVARRQQHVREEHAGPQAVRAS